jgi:hypothetical protein
MRIVKTIGLFLTIIAICLQFSSCIKKESSSNDFIIKVDSIKAPDSVSSGTSFDIEFFGTIGFDGCNGFKTFNKVDKKNDIVIEAVGTYHSSSGTCPPQLVLLDGQKLNLIIVLPGTYRIIIKEPEDFSIVEEITVI